MSYLLPALDRALPAAGAAAGAASSRSAHHATPPRAARRHLPAPAGAAGRDPRAVGRPTAARGADGARPLHPAGGVAGAASGLGPDLLGGELRVPARPLGPSGGARGAGPPRRGSP